MTQTMAILVSCQTISKSYGIRPLFQGISLGLYDGERMGLIGPNGAGKTTLLRILAGLEAADNGQVARRTGVRIGYVAQEAAFREAESVEEVLRNALADSTLEAFERGAEIASLMARMGFADGNQSVGSLSGGWRRRLDLARELIRKPDLLLMDEPTNHLDIEAILWLERLLESAPFAYVIISHDRAFLENTTSRTVELSRAYPDGYLSVDGPYSDFLLRRDELMAAQASQQHALAGQVKREVAWLRRGAQARTTKARYRIEEAGRLISEFDDVKFRNEQGKTVDIDFSATHRRTKELLVAKGVAKAVAGRPLFAGLDLVLAPGTRIGLLGPNGSGKTTLLRILTGEWPPDKGRVTLAEGARIIWFRQDRDDLDRDMSLRRTLSPSGDTVVYRGSALHVSAWAKRFLFQPEQLDMPVGRLSGGEQARVLVARLMLQPADVLILDEPTNDLDIPTLEVLEESLVDFPGSVVLVTHDRYMLDRVSTELLALDGKGGYGHFAEYAQWERSSTVASMPAMPSGSAGKPDAASAPAKRPAASGLTATERRELGRMEEAIMAAEEEVAALRRKLEDPVVASDAGRLQECWNAVQSAAAHVDGLYARWADLEARRAAASNG